jgi:hypothetical protein
MLPMPAMNRPVSCCFDTIVRRRAVNSADEGAANL